MGSAGFLRLSRVAPRVLSAEGGGGAVVAVSTFSWLDSRDEDRRRVRDALSAFDQPGMVDPLDFGVVRDAFSAMLFPGISTVQTRARYFLLVSWAYHRLDVESGRPRDGARRARSR